MSDEHTAEKDAPRTEWIVFCETHRHYLVRASVGGTTWTDSKGEAHRFATKPQARKALEVATWLDHRLIVWAVPGRVIPPGSTEGPR